MENFNCNIRFAKGYNLNVLIQNVHEKIKIGKNFAKGFNLKIHLQNVHEIEKISTKPHASEHDWHFENLQNSNVKFVQKKLLERKILKCLW